MYPPLALPLLATCLIAGAAGAQPASIVTANPTAFLNGGIGEDEADAMRSKAHEFPLRLIFADGPRNEFTANIPVVISDARGNSVLALPDAGPMLYVMLPEGIYTVTAQADGITKTQHLALKAGQGQNVVFHWNTDAASPLPGM
jgi:hypothetical protein